MYVGRVYGERVYGRRACEGRVYEGRAYEGRVYGRFDVERISSVTTSAFPGLL